MKPRPACLFGILLSVSIALLACGGSNHPLQSVSVSPSAAAGSQVQFTATGRYNSMPTTADITNTTTWCIALSNGVCAADIAIQVTVTNGLAQCGLNFSGTVTILAGQPINHPGINQGAQLQPFGAAQLTCP